MTVRQQQQTPEISAAKHHIRTFQAARKLTVRIVVYRIAHVKAFVQPRKRKTAKKMDVGKMKKSY